MPCRSDHLVPSEREFTSLNVLRHLRDCGLKPTGDKYSGSYGNVDALDGDVARLCGFLRGKTAEWIRDNTSLELQIFWRDYKNADAKRKEDEALEAAAKAVRKRALAKLTPAE